MKALRIWLLLLLAALIPIRGAVAAAMLCPPGGVGTPTELRVMGHAMDHHGAADGVSASHGHGHEHGPHDHDGHDHGASAQADATGAQSHEGGTPDKCNVCSAFCSLTPLLSSAPTLPAPPPIASAAFPALAAPVPTFLSGGQDRPPRSI